MGGGVKEHFSQTSLYVLGVKIVLEFRKFSNVISTGKGLYFFNNRYRQSCLGALTILYRGAINSDTEHKYRISVGSLSGIHVMSELGSEEHIDIGSGFDSDISPATSRYS